SLTQLSTIPPRFCKAIPTASSIRMKRLLVPSFRRFSDSGRQIVPAHNSFLAQRFFRQQRNLDRLLTYLPANSRLLARTNAVRKRQILAVGTDILVRPGIPRSDRAWRSLRRVDCLRFACPLFTDYKLVAFAGFHQGLAPSEHHLPRHAARIR